MFGIAAILWNTQMQTDDGYCVVVYTTDTTTL